MNPSPTPYPDANEILNTLFTNVKDMLQNNLIGMSLFDSLANGDYDEHSDKDVLVVTDTDITIDLFEVWKAMNEWITKLDSPWSIQLEVSFTPLKALRRHDPARNHHPHMDRGNDEALHIMGHDSDWAIQRHILRERGIRITGPDLKPLVDPDSPEDLKWAVWI